MENNIFFKISKFLLYLAPLTLLFVYQASIFPFIVAKYAFFRTLIGSALIFFVWGWATNKYQVSSIKYQAVNPKSKILNPKSQLFDNPLVIMTTVFVFIFVLSGFLGHNPSASFWANYERGEGSLQIITLFIFFGLLIYFFQDEKSWKRLFAISLWAAVLAVAYGAAAALKIDNFVGPGFCQRIAGSLGNAAYLGTYMIFAVFYGAYLFINSDKPLKRWKFLILILLFFPFLLLSQTRGALLGLFTAILAGLIYLVFVIRQGRNRKIILGLIAGLIILGSVGLVFRREINLLPFCPSEVGGGNRILDISFSGETYQTRLLLWKQALQAFRERPLLGWGPENFNIAFEKYFDVRHNAWFDRAHNIFFDYLVFSGLLGLLSFLGIFGAFYYCFFKYKRIEADNYADKRGKNNVSGIKYQVLGVMALLFSLPIAYLVQGLVLFDVLPIYINLFLFLAFAVYKFQISSINSKLSV